MDNYQGPGKYEHYKGGKYRVLGLALQENTVVKPDDDDRIFEHTDPTVFVIYQPLTPGSMLENRSEDFWARELDDFNEDVRTGISDVNDMVPRFKKMNVTKAYYFGCYKGVGHGLYEHGEMRPIYTIRDRDDNQFPFNPDTLDGKYAPGGHTTGHSSTASQRLGQVAVHHVEGWTIIAMWDRSVDSRGNSNAAFIFNDPDLNFDAAMAEAVHFFPDIMSRISNQKPGLTFTEYKESC